MNYHALLTKLRRVEAGVASLGAKEFEVTGISLDSRSVKPGYVFAALPGMHFHGEQFVADAIKRGASALLCERRLPFDVPQLISKNARRAFAKLCAQYYENPTSSLKAFGITGTNGKTTSAFLLQHILKEAGRNVGMIGTVSSDTGSATIQSSMTTPEAHDLQQWLARMVRNEHDSVVMEVSSHALEQHRTTGIDFDVTLFTNLTQDHLDYHETMLDYLDAKAKLFERQERSGRAVINIDDPSGWELASRARGKVLTYGTSSGADYRISIVELSTNGSRFEVATPKKATLHISSPLVGEFNVYNITGALVAAIASGVHPGIACMAVESFSGAPGRMQAVFASAESNDTQTPSVFVDYAHTPDALLNVLQTLKRTQSEGRIITVFGCGGDRDRTKRPQMGAIAEKFSDHVVVTSDNPRSEDPHRIIDDILAGIQSTSLATSQSRSHSSVSVVIDRASAIQHAIEIASKEDVVLIAGKGHENYQIIGSERKDFDDVEVAMQSLAQHGHQRAKQLTENLIS